MSAKAAAKFVRPGDVVQFAFMGERINELLDVGANVSPMAASLDATLHVLVTEQAILLIGTNPVTGNPSTIRHGFPRATRIGPLHGRRGNQITVLSKRYKLSKDAVKAVEAADAAIAHLGPDLPSVAEPHVPAAGAAAPATPGLAPSATGRAASPPGPVATGVFCPVCGAEVQPTWDWCQACGHDPEGLRPGRS